MNAVLRQTVRAFLVAAAVSGAFASSALAQATGNVRGRVTEAATGRAVASVQVFIPGTSRGTLTNARGEYMIQGVSVGEVTVTAQIIGYNTQQKRVTVTSGETVTADFALATSTVALDEIVVTGVAGATQKRAIGNTVSKIDAAKLVEDAPSITRMDQVLMARTPGLTIMPGAGTAGAAAAINIRGSGSIEAGNRPTFYVDGIKVQSSLGGDYSVLGQTRSPLDAINPDDIESIEVIKGPAAATLYGADAASGVIQIITKKGKIGQQGLQWNAKVTHGSVGWFLDHPVNWKECTAALIRTSATTWPGCAGKDSLAARETRIIQDSPLDRNGQCAAWLSAADCAALPATQAIRDGMTEGYSLSVRGGGERFSFYGSGDQDFERGVFFNNDALRKSARANVQFTPFDKLETTLNVGYSRINVRLPLNDNASNGLLRNAYRGEPGRSAPWEAGYLQLGPREINTVDNVTDDERFLTSMTANFKPFTWFTNRLTIGLEKNDRLAFDFTRRDTTGRAPFGAISATGVINRARSENHNWSVDYAGTTTFDLNENINSATSVGLQYNVRKYHLINGTGEGLVANSLNLIGSAAVTRAGEQRIEQSSAGFYVQEQVALRNRVFLTGALRFDDNSAFGSDFSWAVYPKLSASWVISEEPFFKYGFVDELKLRTAWGKAGNAPAPFSADRTLTTTTATLIDGTSGNAVITDDFGNPNLHAEAGQEFEIGFDAGLFNNRAGVEFTYYNQHTKDALIELPVPPSSGFSGNVLRNVGEISNSGLELALFGTPVASRNFVWEVRGTLATYKNKLIDLGGSPPDIFGAFVAVQRHVEGYPLAGYWAYDVVRDANGRPVLDANGRATQNTDTAFVGPSSPTREFGLTNTVTVLGNLRLYAFADYKGGHYLWSAREWWRSFNQNISQWVNDPAIPAEDRAAYATGSTRLFIDNADFIKLREVSATYTLPRSWAEKFRARGMSFTVSGRNLAILWTKYDLGADPELNFSGDAIFTRTDYMSVPMMRYYTATVNLSF